MTRISMREARKHLSELIDAANRGEQIILTRRGKNVARLMPAADTEAAGLPDLKDFRASLKIIGRSLTNELLDQRNEERF